MEMKRLDPSTATSSITGNVHNIRELDGAKVLGSKME